MSSKLPAINETEVEVKYGDSVKFESAVDPHDLEGSSVKLMGMFDELASVIALVRNVQTENTRLKNEVEEHKQTIRQLRSQNVWRP